MTNSGGFSTYSDEFLEENRKFEALEKRIVSEATVLEGAVYHHYNADGSFAGISQGEPLESTRAERRAARRALRLNGSERFAEETFKTPPPENLSGEQKSFFTQLIQDNPPGYESEIKELKKLYSSDLGNVNPFDPSQINNLPDIGFNDYIRRANNYSDTASKKLESLSDTAGTCIILPDGESDRFFEKVEARTKNFFDKASKVNDFTTNLPAEITKLTESIGAASQTFVGRISNSLQDSLVSLIDGGMSKLASLYFSTNPIASIAISKIKSFQGSLIGPVNKLFSGMECLTTKVTQALKGVISDMLTGMTKNMINAPTCAIQQFIGAVTNKIGDAMADSVTPALQPILSILAPIGANFDVKSAVLGGINFMQKSGDLFKCAPPAKQTSSGKYCIDQGLKKDKSQSQSQNLLTQALGAASSASSVVDRVKQGLDSGVPQQLSKFEEKYGQWSIFGSKVGEATDQGIGGGNCYTGNNFSCGPATIDFFGGTGEGASGKVILGSFITKFDKDDLFGTLSKTAGIMGVEITNPGEGYAEPPLVSFNDKCNQGFGAYAKAIIDEKVTSPTYGQVIKVVILSEGANYPTDGLDEVEAFISDLIIEDPGSGYEDGVISEDIVPIIRNGRVEAVEIREQIPYKSLPELFVESETGSGAVIRPIMSTKREDKRTDPTVSGAFKVIQCVGTFPVSEVSPIDEEQSVVRETDSVTTVTTTTSETMDEVTTETSTESVEESTTTTSTTQTTTQTQTTTPVQQQSTPPAQQQQQQSTPPPTPPSTPPSGGGGYGY